MRWMCVLLLVAACGSSSPPADRPTQFGGSRPADLKVPPNLDGTKAYPLLVVLHGYGANGFAQEAVFGVTQLAASGEAFLIAPDGLIDSTGHQYWNADPDCCDFDHTGVDDGAYLGTLIDDIMIAYPEIDPTRVFVLGHSNGGYMAYRMACLRADVISSIGVLAGVASQLPCTPSHPVSVLHMHGTADGSVPYASAVPSVQKWAGYDGCAATRTKTGMLDIETKLAGAETTVEVEDGCPAGVEIELWTLQDGVHLPAFNANYEPAVWAWFGAHHR